MIQWNRGFFGPRALSSIHCLPCSLLCLLFELHYFSYFLKFIFWLKYSWFTVLYQFLLYSKVAQPYILFAFNIKCWFCEILFFTKWIRSKITSATKKNFSEKKPLHLLTILFKYWSERKAKVLPLFLIYKLGCKRKPQ